MDDKTLKMIIQARYSANLYGIIIALDILEENKLEIVSLYKI
jgi:hypothetical protein